MLNIPKPQEGEYTPYTIAYIDEVPDDGQVISHLEKNINQMKTLVQSLVADTLTTPHEAGEWTVQEVLVHVIDAERVFAYRALRMARGDTTPLPGFEQDDYIAPSKANDRTLDSILEEYDSVRQATLTLLNSFDESILLNATLTSGHATSLRALIHILAGHELHHLASIKENYG
jgi:uncharacterized damage-inducible protein DinB